MAQFIRLDQISEMLLRKVLSFDLSVENILSKTFLRVGDFYKEAKSLRPILKFWLRGHLSVDLGDT